MASKASTKTTRGCFNAATGAVAKKGNHHDKALERKRPVQSSHHFTTTTTTTTRGSSSTTQQPQQANQPGKRKLLKQTKENTTTTTRAVLGRDKSTNTLPAPSRKEKEQDKNKRPILVEIGPNVTITLSTNSRTTAVVPSDKHTLQHAAKPLSKKSTTTECVPKIKPTIKETITAAAQKLQSTQTTSSANNIPPFTRLPLCETTAEPTDTDTLSLPDPDEKDRGNPAYCAEYVKDIYNNLLIFERQQIYTIRSGYLDQQTEVKAFHRKVVVDWLVQVHQRLAFNQETLYITVDILDRVLQIQDVPKVMLQLVGVTSLLIASKYEEIYPTLVSELAYLTADTYTSEEVRKMERTILRALQYQLNKPIALHFLRRYSKIAYVDFQIHNLVKYILELSFLSTKASSCLPSVKAASAFLLAQSILSPKKTDDDIWTPLLVKHSQYTISDLQEAKGLLRRILIDGHGYNKFAALREKFSTARYHKVSTIPALRRLA